MDMGERDMTTNWRILTCGGYGLYDEEGYPCAVLARSTKKGDAWTVSLDARHGDINVHDFSAMLTVCEAKDAAADEARKMGWRLG